MRAGTEIARRGGDMNGISDARKRLRLDRRFILRSSAVLSVVSFAVRCVAATSGTDSAAPAPTAIIAAVPATTLSGSELNQAAVSAAPAQYREFPTFLGQTEHFNPALGTAFPTPLNPPPAWVQVIQQ